MGVPAASSSSGLNLSSVEEAMKAWRFSEMAGICDALELEAAAAGLGKPQDWPYAVHILAHVVVHDLNTARFVWKQIPASVKQNQPEVVAAWRIAQCMWTRDHAGVHEALRSYDWSPELQPLVSAVAQDYSTKIFQLLSTAYSTISIADAARYLGLTESETATFTAQYGWVLDPATRMLSVTPIVSAPDQKRDKGHLQDLTEYVFHLEH